MKIVSRELYAKSLRVSNSFYILKQTVLTFYQLRAQFEKSLKNVNKCLIFLECECNNFLTAW